MSTNQKYKCNEGGKHRWYDVIVAWASGEKIQTRCSSIKDNWRDIAPDFDDRLPAFNNPNNEWRIKPKTETKKYRMALVQDNFGQFPYAIDVTDDPIEYNIEGFIRWVGDITEIEVEV